MLLIQGKNLYIEHPDKTKNILSQINFHINQNSRIGLIGENGSGKTTFLNLLQGKYQNYKGDINFYFNQKSKISTVVQEIQNSSITLEEFLWQDHPLFNIKSTFHNWNAFDKTSQDSALINTNISNDIQQYSDLGGYDFEILIDKKLNFFGFDNNDLMKKISEFSGGEKTKISIIKSNLTSPELFLFDEPVNNLDSESIDWFIKYLENINKPFIIVSHERNILDKCVNTIWEIDNNLNIYTGNYSNYKTLKNDYIQNIKIKNENIDRSILKLNDSITKRKQKAESFENFKGTRSIKKNGGICSRDEGSGSARLSIKKMMKGATALESRKEKLISEKIVIKKDNNVKMIFNNNLVKAKTILNVKELCIYFDKFKIENLNLNIKADDKINISGKNGTGKTTLLKILCGINRSNISYEGIFNWSPQVKISYFSQNHDNLNFENTCFKEISDSCSKSESEIRKILAHLGLTHDKIFNKISKLSLGERAKIILAQIMLSESNVLILDEPTNHLDIKSKESLEEALSKFKGCILFISHDSYFTNKIASEFINLEEYIS